MPRSEYYDPELAKKDPLTTLHIKVPQSVVVIFNREARDKQRHSSFLMRQQLIERAKELAAEHEAADKLMSRQRKSRPARRGAN